MHFDLPLALYDRHPQRGLLRDEFVPELRAGGVELIGAALYIEEKYLPEMALRVALDQVARLLEEIELADQDTTSTISPMSPTWRASTQSASASILLSSSSATGRRGSRPLSPPA